ncbi:MAG: FAD:protein FMN transferase [Lachnospiraceae bacterium]|nr:FAD:protein FMN transferase [Lachnospiraceae bacterium]
MAEEEANKLIDSCMETADHYDRDLFSAHAEGTDLSNLNRRISAGDDSAGADAQDPTGELRIAPETARLIDESLIWRERTRGAFSPALGAVISLWNFGGDPPGPVPNEKNINEALSHTDASGIHVTRSGNDPGTARIRIDDPRLLIDLGGIAKGYIADRMKEQLTAGGVTSAVINLGGNVLLIGAHPDGSDFRIGIRDPKVREEENTDNSPLLTIPVRDQSVVTSGIYERYFIENGVRYHHVLDPETGCPADTGLASVTILSGDSTTGDALSTACLVLGQEKGQALIESLPGVEALFVSTDGVISSTPGFPKSLN